LSQHVGQFGVGINIQAFSSTFRSTTAPTVVQYCCLPQIKEWIDNGAPNQVEGGQVNMLNLVATATADGFVTEL
jgi:hypothetical protein